MGKLARTSCTVAIVAAVIPAMAWAQSQVSRPVGMPPQPNRDSVGIPQWYLSMPNRIALRNGEKSYLPVNLRGYALSLTEQRTLKALHAAIWSSNPNRGRDLLPGTQASVQSADARYVLSAMKIDLGRRLKDRKLEAQGTDEVLASGRAPNWAMDELFRNQAVYALESGNLFKAETALERYRAARGDDPNAIATLAIFKAKVGKFDEAAPLFDQAIGMRSRAGKKVPQLWRTTAEAARRRI